MTRLESTRGRSWLRFVGLLVMLPLPASGQNLDPAGAEALFRRAREAKARGDDATACPLFVESQRLDPSVGTLMNVAECEEKAGHLASAWEHWHESLDQLLRTHDERAAMARSKAEAIESRLPKLTIHLSPGAKGAHVQRDGIDVGTPSLDIPLPVDPGSHELSVTLANHESARRLVVVEEGQSLNVTLEPGASLMSHVSAIPISQNPRRTWGIVAIGVSGAGLVAAVTSAIVVAREKGVVDEYCNANKSCSMMGVDAAATGKTWDAVNAVSSIFTLIAGGTGLALVLTSRLGTTTVTPANMQGRGGFSLVQVF